MFVETLDAFGVRVGNRENAHTTLIQPARPTPKTPRRQASHAVAGQFQMNFISAIYEVSPIVSSDFSIHAALERDKTRQQGR